MCCVRSCDCYVVVMYVGVCVGGVGSCGSLSIWVALCVDVDNVANVVAFRVSCGIVGVGDAVVVVILTVLLLLVVKLVSVLLP